MKKLLLIAFLGGLVLGCSHSQLKRCPQPAPDNVYHCEKKIDGDFKMCEKDAQAFQCVDPQ